MRNGEGVMLRLSHSRPRLTIAVRSPNRPLMTNETNSYPALHSRLGYSRGRLYALSRPYRVLAVLAFRLVCSCLASFVGWCRLRQFIEDAPLAPILRFPSLVFRDRGSPSALVMKAAKGAHLAVDKRRGHPAWLTLNRCARTFGATMPHLHSKSSSTISDGQRSVPNRTVPRSSLPRRWASASPPSARR
jgi:hypothetical protein